MFAKIRRLKKVEDLIQLERLLENHIPISYFFDSISFGVFHNNELKAGYCLKHIPLDEMRTIQRIPEKERGHLIHEDPFRYIEIVGFWAKDKFRWRLGIHLIWNLLKVKGSYFVYSYLAEDKETEKLLRIGNPLRLFVGKPLPNSIFLPVPIHVEILSKGGILKISVKLAIRALTHLFS